MARTHIENTSCNTCSVVAYEYIGRYLAMGLSIVGCLFVADLFTQSLPSDAYMRHNINLEDTFQHSVTSSRLATGALTDD
jgi:hypothetical protein